MYGISVASTDGATETKNPNTPAVKREAETIYEVVRHRIPPPVSYLASGAEKPFRDGDDWLTYRLVHWRIERT